MTFWVATFSRYSTLYSAYGIHLSWFNVLIKEVHLLHISPTLFSKTVVFFDTPFLLIYFSIFIDFVYYSWFFRPLLSIYLRIYFTFIFSKVTLQQIYYFTFSVSPGIPFVQTIPRLYFRSFFVTETVVQHIPRPSKSLEKSTSVCWVSGSSLSTF